VSVDTRPVAQVRVALSIDANGLHHRASDDLDRVSWLDVFFFNPHYRDVYVSRAMLLMRR
jgi:hypothetical protein